MTRFSHFYPDHDGDGAQVPLQDDAVVDLDELTDAATLKDLLDEIEDADEDEEDD